MRVEGIISRYVPAFLSLVITPFVLWYAISLYVLAPFVFERLSADERRSGVEYIENFNLHTYASEWDRTEIQEYVDCIYWKTYEENKFNIALWISTFKLIQNGTSGVETSGSLKSILNSGVCGPVTWLNEEELE